jgi:hypothetical protein
MGDRRLCELSERERWEQEQRWLTEDPAYFEWLNLYEQEMNKWESLQATKAEQTSSPSLPARMSASA